MKASDIIDFWFGELSAKDHFAKSDKLDAQIKERFLEVYERGAQGELFSWRSAPEGRLAEIIVLDQFPRNIFRGTPRAFATDPLALVLAQEAVASGIDLEIPIEKRAFLYLPYMHSESALIHEQALELFRTKAAEENLQFEIKHKEIIDRFGRYPHRNEILGRKSTSAEIEFLKGPGSSF